MTTSEEWLTAMDELVPVRDTLHRRALLWIHDPEVFQHVEDMAGDVNLLVIDCFRNALRIDDPRET